MAYGASGAGAAAAAAVAQAIKASGAIVRVSSADFMTILSKCEKPLVVVAEGGVFKKHLQYLAGYKGLVFFTKSDSPVQLPADAEIVKAGKIWIPG